MSKCGDNYGLCNNDECCNSDGVCGPINDDNCLNDLNNIYHGKNAIDKLDENKYNDLLNIHNNSDYIISTDDTCGIDLKNRLNKVCPENKCCSVDNICRQGKNFCDPQTNLSLKYDLIDSNNKININKYHGKNSQRIPVNNLNINGQCGLGNNGEKCIIGCCDEDNMCSDKCYFLFDGNIKNLYDIVFDIPKTNEEQILKKKIMNINFSDPNTYLKKSENYLNSLYEQIYTKNKNKIIESKNNSCGINISNKKLYKCPNNKCCDENEECKDVCEKKIDYNNKNIDNKIFDGNTKSDNNTKSDDNTKSDNNTKSDDKNIIIIIVCIIVGVCIISYIIYRLIKKKNQKKIN